MGPRSFERGNQNLEGKALEAVLLQWGLVLSNEETQASVNEAINDFYASMGPRSFERGNHRALPVRLDLRRASMGPRSFERGNYGRGCTRNRSHSSFNGASFFRTRKLCPGGGQSCWKSCFNGASFFRTRKHAVSSYAIWGLAVLQWGLVLSNEETHLYERSRFTKFTLQWGLVLSNEETHLYERSRFTKFTLQWGLVLSNEETRRRCGQLVHPVRASMGPRSFERGNIADS